MVETMLEWRELTPKEKMVIDQFLQSDITCYSDNRFSVMGDKNLILIIVESLNSWVIDLKIDDEEITPNLNRYCREDNSIVALRIQPQVKDGRSSDAHFIYNTGLLPIENGATAVRFGACNYPSLAKALKGYSSFEVVCDNASIWNQEVTSHSYGFKKLYDALSYVGKKGEITDKEMFDKAFDVLKEEPQPFYAQLVTITMHQPYNQLIVPPTAISESLRHTPEVRNYLEATHYFDAALGNFMDRLKEHGLYDNSIIVIISDHNEMNKNVLDKRFNTELTDQEIPMIILNASKSLRYENVIGQVDVYPTLLDLMGKNEYYWKGLGHSLFRTSVTSAVLWSGEVAGDTEAELTPAQGEAWNISDLIITKHYFATEKKE